MADSGKIYDIAARILRDVCIGLFFALLVLVGYAISLLFPHNPPQPPLKPQVDTLYIHDTIRIATPVPTHTEPDVRVDTLWLHDTVPALVPIERKTYEDSSYRAVVSGWHPSLDTLDIYQTTTIIEKQIPVPVKVKPRWTVGITAGYGAGKDGLTPYVGVGVTYGLLSF